MELRKTWKYHVALGAIVFLMGFFGEYVYGGGERFLRSITPFGILLTITFCIAYCTVYFLNYLVVCPETLGKRKLLQFFVAAFLMLFVFAGIRFLLEEVIVFKLTGHHNYVTSKRVLWYYVFDNAYYAMKSMMFSTSMFLLFMYGKNKDKIHDLQIEQKRAELDLLKSQLEPHFIFNTLNVFYTELVDTRPEVAKGIHKLSDLLRYVTYEAHQDYMPLERELTFINDYVFFYRKRFEENMFFDFNIEGRVHHQKIPPLLLIHFVENIFKHGVLNQEEHPASLYIQVGETYLQLRTQNKISNGQDYSSKGIGRENLMKRLKLIFDDDYELQYSEEGDIFSGYLKLPLKV